MAGGFEGCRCPACLSKIQSPIWVVPGIPITFFPVQTPRFNASLELAHCALCGHYSQPSPDHERLNYIYDIAYAEAPFQPGDYNEIPYAKPFMAVFDAHAKAITGFELLEIGCGDPRHLLPFAEKGFSCLGIDPSPAVNTAPPHPRVAITKGYVEQVAFSSTFDVILMRFCLEHIVNIDALISRCRDLLKPGGMLFIQVPNNEFSVTHRPPLFAAHEHIHYFTRQSLDTLLMRHGFTVTGGNHAEEPGLIGVYARGKDWQRQHDDFMAVGSRIEVSICEFLHANPNPVFYGWGMTFLWILSKFDLSACKGAVIDDAPQFFGKPVPGTNLLVGNLTSLDTCSGHPFLLCLNPIYHASVKTKIRERFPEAKVFGVTPEGVYLLE